MNIRLVFFIMLHSAFGVAAPASKPQQLTSPDQVPEGLAKSDWSSIRAAYEAGRHAFMPIEGGWQARNPGQQWTTRFDGRGFLATLRDGDWTWGLELKSYGRGTQLTQVSGKPAVKAEGQRLSYQWDAAVQEWWVNDPRGLEHGYVIQSRPEGDAAEELSFLLGTRGSLRPKISTDAKGVEFCDASGTTVLNYTGLKVWDADGKVLPSRFESVEKDCVRLLVDERNARYPLTIDPIAQQAYLKAGNNGGATYDQFGFSVAVAEDTVVVGAPFEDSSSTGVNSTPDESATDAGAAYVFVRSAGVWTQQAYLKPAAVGTSQVNDQFGLSVAVAGDTVVIGAIGEGSSTLGVQAGAGTPNESADAAGAAYIFVRNAGVWTQQAYLKPAAVGTSQAGDQFGWSVAVAGDTVVVGANQEDSSTTGVQAGSGTPNESANLAGAAYVFARSAGVWTQQAYLKPAAVGTTQEFDQFGQSVAVAGDTVVVGATGEDSGTAGVNSTADERGSDAGAAYLFTLPDIDNDGLLDSWEVTQFGTTSGHSPMDDDDHDGLVNLLELAFGLNPTLPNGTALPPATTEGDYLTLTLTKQPGVSYEVQSASTLLLSQPDSFSATSTTVLINDATILKVRDNFLIGNSTGRFMRVKVMPAP